MTERNAAQQAVHAALAIGVLLTASFVVVLNETIMTVALPRLMVDFKVSVTTAQWLTTAYMLTMATVIPITGYIVRRYSTRAVFAAASAVFISGTVLAALAPGFGLLLVARVVQAGGAAVMLPLLMTTALALAPAGRTGARMGVVTVVLAVAPAIGPALSGLILQVLSWRYLFLVLLPIALLALIAGMLFLRNIGTSRPGRLDGLSVLLAVMGFGPFVLGLSQLGEVRHGAASGALAAGLIVVGAGAIALFARRQKALADVGEPVLDTRVFAAAPFRAALSILLLCMATYFGALLTLPFYLQRVLGLDTFATGMAMLPGGLLMGAMGPVAGRCFDRFGPRLPIIAGTAVLTASYAAFGFLGPTTPVWLVAVLVAVFMGPGMGALCTPAVAGALDALPAGRHADGNAVLASLQQVAGAAGNAVLAAVLSLSVLAAGTGNSIAGQLTGIRIGFAASAAVAALAFLLALRFGRGAHRTPRGARLDGVGTSPPRPLLKETR